MATHLRNDHRSRHHRARRLVRAVGGHWLLVLVSHTVASIVVLAVAHFLHVPACGGE